MDGTVAVVELAEITDRLGVLVYPLLELPRAKRTFPQTVEKKNGSARLDPFKPHLHSLLAALQEKNSIDATEEARSLV